MSDLQFFQTKMARMLCLLAVVHVPALAAISLMWSTEFTTTTLIATVLAALPVGLRLAGRPVQLVGMALAVCLVGQASLFVFLLKGHPWQVEAHFYYFAVLAMLAGFCQWRILAVAAALIVLHHLVLNTFASAMIFPGGSDLQRVAIHVAIIGVETVMLTIVSRIIAAAFARAEAQSRTAQEALLKLANTNAAREEEMRNTTQRADEMSALLRAFESELTHSTDRLHGSTLKLQENSTQLGVSAARFKARSVAGSIAADDTRARVALVASAGHELALSIAEVGDNASGSSRLAAAAVQEAETTSAAISDMAAMAQEIGNVTNLIGAIAGQTNLLALNATIEAARAGESGRGFAVVAQEVKALAAQTAQATQEISERIRGMQTTTARSVEAIHGVSETIRELDAYSARIAAAVAQQSVAAQEIAFNVESASSGVYLVNDAVGHIETLAYEATTAVATVEVAAREVAAQTEHIKSRMQEFRVRAQPALNIVSAGV